MNAGMPSNMTLSGDTVFKKCMLKGFICSMRGKIAKEVFSSHTLYYDMFFPGVNAHVYEDVILFS